MSDECSRLHVRLARQLCLLDLVTQVLHAPAQGFLIFGVDCKLQPLLLLPLLTCISLQMNWQGLGLRFGVSLSKF